MAFEGLTQRLQQAFGKVRGKGSLTEEDVKLVMREVRMALLEADVNYKVVKDFVKKATERCIGQETQSGLSTQQQVVKIVNEELTELMGGSNARLQYSSSPISVFMLCGLQGAGKTTMSAKLANWLKKDGKRPLLVGCDIYRPAAIKQLQVVGGQVGVPVYEHGTQDPVKTALEAVEYARQHQRDVVILDTAGRLHIDEALMTELQNIKAAVNPAEILLVIDAMIGQDAVATAQAFDDALDITGVMLTKLDGDARGGAALSIKALTGKPIKFAGIGEKLDQIEPFHPDRMASRILGMGDVLTLIEKAEQNLDQKKAEEMAERLRQNRFTLTDYYDQLQQLKGMGSLQDIAGMIPGMDGKALSGANVDEKAMGRIEAIIQSMTPGERDNPAILNSSRKKRIAAGAGTSVVEINKLLKQFELMQQLVRQMSGNSKAMKRMKRGGRGGFGGLGNLFGGGGRPYGF